MSGSSPGLHVLGVLIHGRGTFSRTIVTASLVAGEDAAAGSEAVQEAEGGDAGAHRRCSVG